MSGGDINLALLPPPNIIEALDFEAIFAQQKADLIALYPDCAATLALESEPLVKLLRVMSYRELLLRQRVNEAARALLLQFAQGAELDHIGVTYHHTARLLITAADTSVTPPTAAVFESDADYQYRLSLAPSGYSTAGPRSAYEFHALSASAEVKNAAAMMPSAGLVDVLILSRSGDGTASPVLLDTVSAALNSDAIRPLCDLLTVKPARIQPYSVVAKIYTYPGVGAELAIAAAQTRLQAYLSEHHQIGHTIARSGIDAALTVSGISNVEINLPLLDIVCAADEAAFCNGIHITFGGVRA